RRPLGFQPDKGKQGKTLDSGVRIVSIETAHDREPMSTGRSYIYFWPGGQTERAAIQLTTASKEEEPTERNSMTVFVSPLTGKTEIKRGLLKMLRPRDQK